MPLSPTPRWHDEVPGTRWFRADLHLHTIDDPPVELPADIVGDRTNAACVRAYAARFLDASIDQGIEVLALTPHSASIRSGLSAAWTILETWKTELHGASGRPYRDLIYAVFPGFEPSFADGNKGLHLIFLFDPEIDKELYLGAFGGIMGSRPAYDGRNLNTTQKRPADAFAELDDAKGIGAGQYVVIAPHPLQPNGLLARPGHYITDLAGGRIHAAELRRDRTLWEDLADNGKLKHAFERGRVALYHTSDATKLPALGAKPGERDLGFRRAVLKLASPTIEALRQAFLARDSRLRIPYVRDSAGLLALASDLPEPCPVSRPWVRTVGVHGGTSFHRDQVFRFSPDLTCIIGGSMTGKSTLLDGLRYLFGGDAGLPDIRTPLGAAVHARARQRFLSGNSTVEIESPAGDLTRAVTERFGIRFYSQKELETLSRDDEGLEHLLFHLVPGRAESLLRQRNELRTLDAEIAAAADRLIRLHEQVAEAQQAFKRTADARTAMQRFAEAGTAALPAAQQDAARAEGLVHELDALVDAARDLVMQVGGVALPTLTAAELAESLGRRDGERSVAELIGSARAAAAAAAQALDAAGARARGTASIASRRLAELTARVQAALVAAGGSATDLNQFEAFARAALHYDSFKDALDRKVTERDRAAEGLKQRIFERDALTFQHRGAFASVCSEIAARFEGRVRVSAQVEGRKAALETWLLGFKAKGVTQWWNNGGSELATPSAIRSIAEAVRDGRSDEAAALAGGLGMSEAVARSFLEQIAPWGRRVEAWALRAPDRYVIQWVEGGEAKSLDDLSGGRKVAVLLSLLLESDDETPLVVDQPEDELDNRFLNETIIPALHRLKGRRQVIFATHNANIVVNGDADQVIALEADAQHGRVYAAGAIEDREVREAILRTLDGGEDAFRLRRAKYGF